MRRQQLSIDICCPNPSSAANPPAAAAAADRRDRQTDGRTLDRFIWPLPHTITHKQALTELSLHSSYTIVLFQLRLKKPALLPYCLPYWPTAYITALLTDLLSYLARCRNWRTCQFRVSEIGRLPPIPPPLSRSATATLQPTISTTDLATTR